MSKTVNVGISDIFFNRDHEQSKDYRRGKFVGFVREYLVREAETVLTELRLANTPDLPSSEELVDDFFNRI